MRRVSFGLLCCAVLALVHGAWAGDAAKDEAIKKERRKFQGSWRVVALELDGNKAGEQDARKLTVINKEDGTWILMREDEEVSRGSSRIDPTAKVKTIDFTVTAGNGSGKEYLGIYELGDNTRKLCFGEKDKGRPAEFSAPAGSGQALVMFERQKK